MKTFSICLPRNVRLATLAASALILLMWVTLMCHTRGRLPSQPSKHSPAPAPPPRSAPGDDAAGVRREDPDATLTPVRNPSASTGAAERPAGLQRHDQTGDAPAWAVGYGKEFWRRPAAKERAVQAGAGETNVALPASLNLADVIERVHHAMGTNDGSPVPQVKAQTYTATFDGEGLRFSPHRPQSRTGVPPVPVGEPSPDGVPHTSRQQQQRRLDRDRRDACPTLPDPGTEVCFRTLSVRRDDAVLFEIGNQKSGIAKPGSVLGNTAQALLNAEAGLIEHYETRAEGVAVTWVLDRAPEGTGPLEVEAELSSLSHAGQTAQGHHYSDASGTARVRVGNVTVVDAAGRRWNAPTTAAGQRLRVRVPEATLAQATYPLAIDPVIGPEFGMDNPVYRPSDDDRYRQDVACNGTHYLVVWTGYRTGGYGIFAARVTRTGTVVDLSGLEIAATASFEVYAKVAASGTDFMVVWSEGNTARTDASVKVARVTADGTVREPNGVPIAPNTRLVNPQVTAAGNGNNWIVAWIDGQTVSTQMKAVRVDRVGNIPPFFPSAYFPSSNNQSLPAVAANGTDYLVLWQETDLFRSMLEFQRIASDGTPLGMGFVDSRPSGYRSVAVASSSGRYLIVWREADAPGFPGRIYSVPVTGNGAVQNEQRNLICSGDCFYDLAVASSASGYLVLWGNPHGNSDSEEIRGTRVTVPGDVQDLAGILIVVAGEEDCCGGVASDGSDYLTTWGETTLRAARVAANGTVLNPGGFPVGYEANAQQSPAAAFNGTDYLVAWADDREPVNANGNIFGARVNVEGTVLTPNGIPISTAAGRKQFPAVAANGADWLVAWEDRRTDPSMPVIYGARVAANGQVLDIGGRLIGTNPGRQTAPVLACNGNNYLAVWTTDSTGISGTRISFAGDALDVPSRHLSANGLWPAVASDASDYLVVWQAAAAPLGIYGTRVPGLGAITPTSISIAPYSSASAGPPAVAGNGVEYLVVWQDTRNDAAGPDLYGSRVARDGTVRDASGFAICTAAGAQLAPVVSASGNEFLVTWQDGRNAATTGFDILGARVRGNVPVDTGGFAINTNPGDQTSSAVVSGGSGLYLVLNQGMGFGTTRVVGNLVATTGPLTRLVTTSSDSGPGSLRDAIAIADNGDRILFAPLVRGKIRLTSAELLINKTLTLVGPGAAQLAVSGNNNSRVFHIGPQGNLDLSGLTITEGRVLGRNGQHAYDPGESVCGGGILNEGPLRLYDCMITSNTVIGGIGGRGYDGQCDLDSNIAADPGSSGGSGAGAGLCSTAALELYRCTVLGNTCFGGTGGDGGSNGNDFDCTPLPGPAGGAGGPAGGAGVFTFVGAKLENCTIASNRATGGAGGGGGTGGIYVEAGHYTNAPSGPGGPGGGASAGGLDGPFMLGSCTVSANSVEGGVGGTGSFLGAHGLAFVAGVTGTNLALVNTIVAGNLAPTFSLNGLNFDGVDDYLSAMPAVPAGNSAYTIEAWINTTAMNNGTIAAWGNFGVPNQVNAFRLTPGGLVNYWWANDLSVATPNLAGAWHHVAATFDGMTRRILLDGAVVASDTPAGHNAGGGNFRIGSATGIEFFSGQMDEVRIWNVGRSAAEIQANMRRQLSGHESGLVSYYRFDEGSGPNAFDATGNANNIATLVNGPTWVTPGPDVFGAVTSRGWNLIGITEGSSGWTTNDFLGNSAFPLAPLLGPCQDNGGPVWTMCPLSGSPARDKGRSGLATDARGGRRIVDFPGIPNAPGGDGSDIGALEVDSLLRILSIAKSNTFARVLFKSDPGNTYILQQTSVVTSRFWTNVVGTVITGNGQNLEAIDNGPLPQTRFYRMRGN